MLFSIIIVPSLNSYNSNDFKILKTLVDVTINHSVCTEIAYSLH
jgi:hypothetical protein